MGNRTPKHTNDRLQGTLDLLVLKILAYRGRMHGYALTLHVEEISEDVLRMEEGSLYPVLHLMTQAGWLKPEWGASDNNRRARFYSTTADGAWCGPERGVADGAAAYPRSGCRPVWPWARRALWRSPGCCGDFFSRLRLQTRLRSARFRWCWLRRRWQRCCRRGARPKWIRRLRCVASSAARNAIRGVARRQRSCSQGATESKHLRRKIG